MCGASNGIQCKLVSVMALDKILVSMRPSMFSSPTFMRKCGSFPYIFSGKFVIVRKNNVSPSGVTWSCGES